MTSITETLATIPAWAGSVPGWIMAVSFLGILWRGLPAVLDAWSNSVAKERDHREREIARLEGQIAASDERHNECLEGQKLLREEIQTMRQAHSEEIESMRRAHSDEIGGLHQTISGMVVQMRQIQMSAVSMGTDGTISPALSSMFEQLDRVGKAKQS